MENHHTDPLRRHGDARSPAQVLECGDLSPPSSTARSQAATVSNLMTADPLKLPWPHAPIHKLTEHGVYMITAGTFKKLPLFARPDRLDLLERKLLEIASQHAWQIEAWAVFANHCHFVARGCPASAALRGMISRLHAESARELNRLDLKEGRRVWFNFWDTKLTYEKSYLARLNYVHQNAVKHGLVSAAHQYRWCSAAWFERVTTPARVQTIYSFKTDRLEVPDDF